MPGRYGHGLLAILALVIAALIAACVQPGYYFAPMASLIAVAIVAGLAGIGYGAINLLPRAMRADVADLERLNCGVKRTGLLFALLTSFWKIGQAVSASMGLGRKAAVKFVSP